VRAPAALNGVFGSSAMDVYAVGDQGAIYHNDGTGWKAQAGAAAALYSVWCSSDGGLVVAVGAGAVFTTTNAGAIWMSTSIPGAVFYSVWGSSKSNVFAVGANDAIYHFDGNGWTAQTVTGGTGFMTFKGVWGPSATEAYAVGGDVGVVFHTTDGGANWVAKPNGATNALEAVWGSSANDVWVVGLKGTLLHSVDQGASFTSVAATTVDLHGLFGLAMRDAFAVGDQDTLLRLH
jgi:photosystem II stability/assembly factor-like uncharacterized protein